MKEKKVKEPKVKQAKPPKEKKPKKEKPVKLPERSDTGGLNYSVYYMKPMERLAYILLAAALLFALGWVFYRNVILSAILALGSFAYPAIRTKQIIAKRRQQLTLQFKDMLYSLSSAIGAGSSVERAMTATLEDMQRQYVGTDAYIVQELELIVSKLEMNRNIEELFADLGERSGIEDICTFANIFEISKRTGGNLIQIIRQTSTVITEKIETKTEIDTILAEKKMEQKVLTVMPIGLVYLLTVTTSGFMDPIFKTIEGRGIATLALGIILVGYFWGKKLTNIEV